MSEKRGKVKALKAWAVCHTYPSPRSIYWTRADARRVAAQSRESGYRPHAVPVLITTITPKQRRKTK